MKTSQFAVLAACLVVTSHAFAMLGAGDTVVVVGNADVGELENRIQVLAQWGEQLKSMTDQLEEAKKVVDLGNQAADIKGDMRQLGQSMNPANSLIEFESGAMDVPSTADLWQKSDPSRALSTDLRYNSGGPIGTSFKVNGETVQRDKKKYAGFEKERSALEIQRSALDEQREIEARELEEIARNQKILAGNPTEAEAAMATAAIEASNARLAAIRLRADRAKGAAENLEQQRDLEKEMLAQKEKEETEARAKSVNTKAAAALKAQENFKFTYTPKAK